MPKTFVPSYMKTKLGKCLNCKKAGVGKIYDPDHKVYILMCKFCRYKHLPNGCDLGATFTNALGEFI